MNTSDYANYDLMLKKYIPEHQQQEIDKMGEMVINSIVESQMRHAGLIQAIKHNIYLITKYFRECEDHQIAQGCKEVLIYFPFIYEKQEQKLIQILQNFQFKKSTRILIMVENKGLLDAMYLPQAKSYNTPPITKDKNFIQN